MNALVDPPAPVSSRPARFRVVGGRVETRSLEVHVVDHCQLRCAQCCSLSPLLPKWCIDPADLARDLALARRALQPRFFKLVGGEPLLHPQIDECLAIARRSGIAPIVSLTTNGFLLPRTSDAFWERVQALTISIYPDPELPAETIGWIEERAARRGIPVNWKRQETFVQMDRANPRDDEAETLAIYDDCWLRRRCHLLSRGRFFTCTRPAHLDTLHGGGFLADGLELHEGEGLAEELLSYLHREAPLLACARCEGGHAPEAAHRQLSPAEVRATRLAWTA